MKDKKIARPSAATLERATAEKAACRASDSFVYHNTAAGSRQGITAYLNTGEAGAVPMRHLRAILHSDSRTIRLEIEQARRRGVPICANNSTGYYIAGSEQERARFVRSMKHRAAEIMETAEAVERAEVE